VVSSQNKGDGRNVIRISQKGALADVAETRVPSQGNKDVGKDVEHESISPDLTVSPTKQASPTTKAGEPSQWSEPGLAAPTRAFYIASSPLSPAKQSEEMSTQAIESNMRDIESMISDDVNLVEERGLGSFGLAGGEDVSD